MIYSYNKSQQVALFLNFISVKNSTCFRQNYCPKHVEFFTKIKSRKCILLAFIIRTTVGIEHYCLQCAENRERIQILL